MATAWLLGGCKFVITHFDIDKEIKKLLPEIEKNSIRSNVDLEKIIGKKRYAEIEDKIKFIE